MPKFLVQNLTEQPLRVGIEPWADLEILAPGAKAEFDCEEPAEIEFAVLGDDRVSVSVVSDRIRVLANGGEKTFKPPNNW
jgi:hypothetical protein